MSIFPFPGKDKPHSFLLCSATAQTWEWLGHPFLIFNLCCYTAKKESILGAECSPVIKALSWEGGVEYFHLEVTYNDHLDQLPDHSMADLECTWLRALSKCLLDMDRLWASITSLEHLFQCLTPLSVKKCFLIFSPCLDFSFFSHIFFYFYFFCLLV